jgi:hypothetical protein
MPVQLFDKDTDRSLGMITDDQFRFLVDELEEESPTDTDYYVDAATIDMLEEDGADPVLIDSLRQLLAGREGVDVRWQRT